LDSVNSAKVELTDAIDEFAAKLPTIRDFDVKRRDLNLTGLIDDAEALTVKIDESVNR
jgi:hypothetical protein